MLFCLTNCMLVCFVSFPASSYENEKRGGGGRGNWGAADGT
jgi:hypothetical protein